jgi:predicted MFS family arabinose efflux permease
LLRFVPQLTGSSAAVGLVILCFDFPGVVTGAILGRLLDRYQPRLVMGFDNLARAALIAAIATLYALGSLQLWHVFVLALLAGALSPATTAGVRAFVPDLVDDAALDRPMGSPQPACNFRIWPDQWRQPSPSPGWAVPRRCSSTPPASC